MNPITEINPKALIDNLSLDQDPEYRKQREELDRHKAALHNLRKQKEDILEGLNLDTRESDDALVQRALARAEGRDVPLIATANSLGQKYEQICMEVDRLEKDCKAKEVQLTKLSFAVAERLTGPLVPHHREIVRQIAFAVVVLSKAIDTDAEFHEHLRLRDIPAESLFVAMPPRRSLGSLKDENSDASAYLVECVERGFLTQREVHDLRASGMRAVIT